MVPGGLNRSTRTLRPFATYGPRGFEPLYQNTEAVYYEGSQGVWTVVPEHWGRLLRMVPGGLNRSTRTLRPFSTYGPRGFEPLYQNTEAVYYEGSQGVWTVVPEHWGRLLRMVPGGLNHSTRTLRLFTMKGPRGFEP